MNLVNQFGSTASERRIIMSNTNIAGGEPEEVSPCVLVVDDDNTVRMILTRQLRKRGFDVFSTGSGAEAIEMYCRSAQPIDLILMDVNMPGLSGPETFAALQAADPGVRCCFMTADIRSPIGMVLLARGALEVFDKPFASLSDLCERLRSHITRPADESGVSTIAEVAQWRS